MSIPSALEFLHEINDELVELSEKIDTPARDQIVALSRKIDGYLIDAGVLDDEDDDELEDIDYEEDDDDFDDDESFADDKALAALNALGQEATEE